MKNISVSLLHTAWTKEEKCEIDDAIYFVENYRGNNFILDACYYLFRLLNTDYILVGLIQTYPTQSVKTHILLKGGNFAASISYPLNGSVCETVIGKEQIYIPAGLQDLFPNNELLKKMQVDSYLGIPVYDNKENAVGCLSLLHSSIIQRGGFVEALITILLPRMEEELNNILHPVF